MSREGNRAVMKIRFKLADTERAIADYRRWVESISPDRGDRKRLSRLFIQAIGTQIAKQWNGVGSTILDVHLDG